MTDHADAIISYIRLKQSEGEREEEAKMIQHWQETGNGEAFSAAMMSDLLQTDAGSEDPFGEGKR